MADNRTIELRRASFKGIPFHVETTEEIVSQRVVVHEYAGRNTPYVEELGLGKRNIKFTAYFIGEGYLNQRDRFIAACEQGGVGTLTHPFFAAQKRVVFISSTWQHDKNAVGRTSVSLEFIESEAPPSPLIRPDTRMRLDQAFQEAVSATIAAFNAVHDVVNVIDYVRDNSVGLIEDVAAIIDTMRLDTIMTPEASASLAASIRDFYDDAPKLVSDESMPAHMGALITAFREGANDATDAAGALGALHEFHTGSEAVLFNTPSRILQQQNQHAIERLVRRLSTVAFCRTLVDQNYQFKEEVRQVRLQASMLIEARLHEISKINEDNIYIAFTNIRTKISEDFDDRAEGLGELLEVEVPRSMPSLVNSWRLYQDPLRAEELVERNRVEHPSWMPHRYAALSR